MIGSSLNASAMSASCALGLLDRVPDGRGQSRQGLVDRFGVQLGAGGSEQLERDDQLEQVALAA